MRYSLFAFGTFQFADLAAFEAGLPTQYTQRIGDPTVKYRQYQFGWYVQDDIRDGLSLGITTIPALLINGQMVDGKLTQNGIEKLIRQELKNHSAGDVKRRA